MFWFAQQRSCDCHVMHTTAGATSPPEGEDGYRASDEGKVVRVDTVGGQDKLTKNEYCRQEKRREWRREGKERIGLRSLCLRTAH